MENKVKEYIDKQRSKGILMKDIVKKAGIGKTSLFDISRGKQIPRIDTVVMIAKALEVKPEDVFPILKGGENDES